MAVQNSDRASGLQASWLRTGYAQYPVVCTWIVLALLCTFLWWMGANLNGDVDDLLKLHEIRFLVETGNIYDRTLPNILQPEPFVTHWPWIVDLPYALVTWLLRPFIGLEQALSVASFAVPLAMLLPALYFFYHILAAIGFQTPAAALPLAVLFAVRSFFEFEPGRIDYHNLEMLLLLAAVALLMSERRSAAAANGAIAALALAISTEFAAFFALVMAVYAYDFIFSARDGAMRLASFGATLSAGAVVLFFAIVPFGTYAVARCDSYSAPHLLALACAGGSFIVLPLLLRERGGWMLRAGLLAGLGAASLVVTIGLFPQCLNGPYAVLSDYARDNWLNWIGQEKSLLTRRNFVLSSGIASILIFFIGALAPVMIVGVGKVRDRSLIILALFSILAVIQSVVWFRYFRYVPLFAGLGLPLVFAAFFPMRLKIETYMTVRNYAAPSQKYLLLAPGLVLSLALLLFHLTVKPAEPDAPAAQLADSCDLIATPKFDWPAQSHVLSSPLVGIHLLSPSPNLSIVAIPFHNSGPGIERAYRFLDPQTENPRAIVDEAKATHVAICAWRGKPLAWLENGYSFASALIEGRPPEWLSECATDPSSPLRIYRYVGADGSEPACPTISVER
ncbi:hypothetical protein [Mesorhizobium sp. YR577]|uniref:hypothetical protein n=1 Tax=Mesorhizobium sp. YR577 TaxID=1884373 RepID=UPI0008F2C952|nr:hypothetical protein [Mesorhizobium sp. YR577]SFU12821.1 hypothetical protein SAMN05518861_11466 [Mesorhizobium sp. YR577]